MRTLKDIFVFFLIDEPTTSKPLQLEKKTDVVLKDESVNYISQQKSLKRTIINQYK